MQLFIKVKITVLALIFMNVCDAQVHDLPSSQSIIDQWFSIDTTVDIDMQQQLIADDEEMTQYLLSFTSDDQQKVNGTMTIPKPFTNQPSIALLLHAMGSDQYLWWKENKVHGHDISKKLLEKGHIVITLDARRHGQRKLDNLTPKDIIAKAHSQQPRIYTDMIIGTIRDYRLLMNWLSSQKELNISDKTLVVGYSMGAQMALILASYEASIDTVIAMVPPYVKAVNSPVAPRFHVQNIKRAQVMIVAAKQDPYSTNQQNQQNQDVFDQIGTQNKHLQWFDSGHLLPNDYYLSVLSFINNHH